MSERGSFRGGRGRGRGGGYYNQSRGGGGGDRSQQHPPERPKKENILDLSKYMDKEVNVKFSGGREGMYSRNVGSAVFKSWTLSPTTLPQKKKKKGTFYNHSMLTDRNCLLVSGILKGYDQLMNLVLDDVKEVMRG